MTSEESIAQALTDAGGPAELAPALIAIATHHAVPVEAIAGWIHWHQPTDDWTGPSFNRFAERYADTTRKLAELRQKEQ